MSGRIEASVRLLTVADQSLGAARASVDDFFNVLRTAPDEATKRAQGIIPLRAALEQTTQGVAAIEAATAGVKGATGAEASLAVLDDTRAAIGELHANFTTLTSSAPGKADINPLGVQTQAEEVRAAVQVAREKLRGLDGADEVADEQVFKEIAGQTKPVKSDAITDAHIDDVTTRASELTPSVGQMPTLEDVGVDMISAARAGKYDNLVGREQEVEQMLTILQRKRKANPILLGDPGVGKTQLVEGLAVRIARGEVPESMRDMKIWSIDAASLKAKAGAEQGAMEKLVKSIVEEVAAERAKGEKVALFVDELHMLMGAGDTSQQLKPALARGDISMIGATTWEEFNKFIAKDGALVRRVAPISVDELSEPQVLDVLRSVQEGLSRHHGTIAYDSAIQEVQRISTRYVRDRKQPDPAIELLDHALSRVSSSWNGGTPSRMLEMANDVGRLKSVVPMLERQVVMGDTKAAGGLVSARARLAELEPKLEGLQTQLTREREVLGTRNALVTKYLGLMDEGKADDAALLQSQLDGANEAVRALRTEHPERLLSDMLDDAAVREAASNLYGRTISAGGADEAKRALRLGDDLAEKVIGQKHATDAIAEAMIGIKSGMKDPDAPAGAFLFTGPTGVGKTQTIRVVTKTMTDDIDNLVRFDMGEYSEAHSVSRLFGSPPGYVGYDDAPGLAALIKNPEAHVLFDEVEKAHPQVFQKLLALIEEGRATLGNGQKIDGRGATFYMTTNLADDDIRKFFSPEFLNRLDLVTRFNHLDKPAVARILELELPDVLARTLENGVDLSVTDAAKSRIIDYGFDQAMGARPLNRSIKNHVTNPSGRMILEMKAAGMSLDGAPQKAILDIDQAGTGFVMRSEDGAISVPVAARKAEDHAPGAAKATHAPKQPTRLEDEKLEWTMGDDAAGAVHPPAPEPQPIRAGE